MRAFLSVPVVLSLCACNPPPADPAQEPDLAGLSPERYDPTRLLVGLSRTGKTALDIQGRQTLPIRLFDHFDIGVYEVEPGEDVLEAIAELRRDPDVDWVEPDYVVHALEAPNDPRFPDQWHLAKVHAVDAWRTSTGAGAVVAVLDTGVQSDHPDGITNLVPGWNFISDNDDTEDDYGHGTHVAGTIGERTNNGIGGAGLAPDASIMPVKVLDSSGSGSFEQVLAGIDFAIAHEVDVISMSLGAPATEEVPEPVREGCDAAWEAGIVVFASSGNDAGAVGIPAIYEHVIAVGATTEGDGRPAFSNFGPELDLAAPGVLILQMYGGSRYVYQSGTSMATPIAAGTGALLAAMGATNQEIRDILEGTAVDLGAPGRDDNFGFGRIDAAAAVAAFVPPCPDDDADDVCNADDVCPGHDDAVDTDADGTPDGCDDCPLDRTDDTDLDGVCDSDDACPGHDDALDADSDGIPDGCDTPPPDTTGPVVSSPTIRKFLIFYRVSFTTNEPSLAIVCGESGLCSPPTRGTSHDSGWFPYLSRRVTLYAVDGSRNLTVSGPWTLPR